MAGPEKKTQEIERTEQDKEIDPATFLFEDDDDDDDDTSDLPPERDAKKDSVDDDEW